MRELFFRLMLIIVALNVHTFAFAADEDVSFTSDAPLLVTVGEPFPVEFALNASPKKDSFVAPNFEGFNVIAGPRISNGTSVQIVNGDITRKVNYTYTFVLIAPKAGRYNIPSAKVTVKGKQYETKVIPIEAVEEDRASQSANNNSEENISNRIGEDDIILRMIASKNSVYKGEPLRVEIKLYSRVNLVGTDGVKLPAFNGFWAQNLANPRSSRGRESYRNKVYDTHVVADYLLYPQQDGELVIEPAELVAVAQIVMQNRNVDPFFGGGHEFYNVRRELKTQPLKIKVKALPNGAPSSFNGAVGNFKMELMPLESKVLMANSASSLNLKISGEGNLTLLHSPKVTLPSSFEMYTVRTTESITNEKSGGVGYKLYEYPFIARAEGDFTIPAIEFSYFDPATKAYTVLKSDAFGMSIKSDGVDSSSVSVMNNFSKSDIEMLGRDIRFIKLDKGELMCKPSSLMFTWLYYVLMFFVLAVFTGVFVVLRRTIRDSHNVALRREKKASKMAIQRFKVAKNNMDNAKEREFYEELQRGIWGYLSDKLNIPVSDLTKEYVRDELIKRGVGQDLAHSLTQLITQCEEAQYFRMSSAQMSELYGEALGVVSQLETIIKRKK